MRAVLLALALLACKDDNKVPVDSGVTGPPLGMRLDRDGVTYAGAAAIDMTPEFFETYTDLNGDFTFSGCMDDPEGAVCGEPFDDVNGNGWFDAVWIGGYGPLRPALGVRDPIEIRAIVMSHEGEYIAWVGMDFVGLGSPRIHAARDRLTAEGFDPDRLLASSSHNHQGPDTMGLWGNPYNFADPMSGRNPEYQEAISDAIEKVVRDAAAAMEPIDLKVGRVDMRDRDPYFNGSRFGGKNPVSIVHGMIYDGRDPVLVSDQLLVLQGNRPSDASTVFTLTNWSGHPEVRGSDNGDLSADWVGSMRRILDAHYGGLTVHLPESLGGMQSALHAELPLVTDDGTHVYETCSAESVVDEADSGCFGRTEGDTRLDEDGDQVPVFAEQDSWDFVESHGWHIAEAAIAALDAGETITPVPLRVEAESFYVPIENVAYKLLGPHDMFDLNLDDATYDTDLCAQASEVDEVGCIETRTFRAQVGPVGFVGVPGELLPELAWGFPEDDPKWVTEAVDTTSRGLEESRYFVQHPRACDDIDYEACRLTDREIDGCDCKDMHAVPYRISYDPAVPPMLDMLDTEYRAVLGMTDNYLSYIVPEPDFNRDVSLLGSDGDHYEDTVSPSSHFGTELQSAQGRISERW
jgi:hypothetical protein